MVLPSGITRDRPSQGRGIVLLVLSTSDGASGATPERWASADALSSGRDWRRTMVATLASLSWLAGNRIFKVPLRQAPKRDSVLVGKENQEMKVLITGGAGFIGSHLGERLLERGRRGPRARRPLDRFNRKPRACEIAPKLQLPYRHDSKLPPHR